MRAIKRHSVEFFTDIANTFFLDKWYFGLAFFALMCVFDPLFFASGLIAAVIGYAYSAAYSTPKALKFYGLITLNCFFFGIAMAGHFAKTPVYYLCLVLGAMAIPLITKAMHEVLQHWKLSTFIMPYILMVWIIALVSRDAQVIGLTPTTPDVTHSLTALMPQWAEQLKPLETIFLSLGRLLFLPDPLFGLGVLALVTVISPRRGAYFFLGTAVATLTAFALLGGSEAWEQGHLSYSAGLVGLGLASFPEKFTWRTIGLFCMFSAFLTMAAAQLLKPLELPVLSLPYVLTMWMAILSRTPKLSVSWAPQTSVARRAE